MLGAPHQGLTYRVIIEAHWQARRAKARRSEDVHKHDSDALGHAVPDVLGVKIESTHTHLMNKEHKNFRDNDMRDLERERQKPIFHGNTP